MIYISGNGEVIFMAMEIELKIIQLLPITQERTEQSLLKFPTMEFC